MMLALGILFSILAVSTTVYVLTASPVSRVPQTRRLAPGETTKSPIEQLVERMEDGVDWILRKRGWNPFPARALELAGIRMPQSSVVTAIVALSCLAFLLGYVVGGAALGLIAGLLTPLMSRAAITAMTRRRRTAFADQLESTLEIIASALRAGHSLPSALDAVSADAQSPTSEEFARIVNEGRLGLDVVAAMRETSARMGNEDFGWIADAVAIQRDTGGNLSEVLDRVGETIRDRGLLAKQVRALSADGRISANVMMVIPLALAAFSAWRDPEAFFSLFGEGLGLILVMICGVLYVVGFFWLRRLTDVKY